MYMSTVSRGTGKETRGQITRVRIFQRLTGVRWHLEALRYLLTVNRPVESATLFHAEVRSLKVRRMFSAEDRS